MALASHLPGSRNADAWLARVGGYARVLALLPIFLTLLAPATARGDVYKWTDERGNMVISNLQPVNPGSVSGVELIAAATKSAAQSTMGPSQRTATPTEQALEARIENLERQLQAQQQGQQPQTVPQSSNSDGYYPAPASPQPDPGYDSGYDSGYASSYDPGYYPGDYPGYYPGYYYPVPLSYSFITVPARTVLRRGVLRNRPGFVSRPVFAGRPPVFAGRAPVFAGRAPVFAGRAPVFAGRAPVFASRAPVFVSQPALGISRRASFGGPSMHGGRR